MELIMGCSSFTLKWLFFNFPEGTLRIFNIDGNVEQFLNKYSIEEIVNKTAIVNIKEINATLNHLGVKQQVTDYIQYQNVKF